MGTGLSESRIFIINKSPCHSLFGSLQYRESTTAFGIPCCCHCSTCQWKLRSQILDENLLAQRGEETIRWPSFWPETQQKSVSLAVPNQNDYETLSSFLLLPMRFSILLPGISILSTASSCQLGAGSVSRSTAILLTQPWVSEYDPIFCNRHPFLLQHLHFLSSFSILIIYTVCNIISLIKLSQIPAYCSICAHGFSFFFLSNGKRLRARLPISLAHLTFPTNYNSLRTTPFWSQFYLYSYGAAKGRSEMLQNEGCADTAHAWLRLLVLFE